MEQLENTSLIPSESVREIETQDGAVLLDIRQGICLSMSTVGLKIWRMLKLNCAISQIADRLASDFNGVPRQEIDQDVAQFIAELGHKGLLASVKQSRKLGLLERLLELSQRRHSRSTDAAPAKTKVPRFLPAKALVGLLVFDLFRLSTNFSRIHSLVKRWPVAPGIVADDMIDRVQHAMNSAYLWYPKRAFCLQRTAVTTCLLRSCGVDAQMTIGAQKLPFKAHAWTEVSGRIINETRDVHRMFLIWDRC